MRGASRGDPEVEQPKRAGAENSAGFCVSGRETGSFPFAGRTVASPVCGARARGSQPRSREASGPGRAAVRPLCEVLAGLGQGKAGNARGVRVPGSTDLRPVLRRENRDAKPQMERRKASALRTRARTLAGPELTVRLPALHPLICRGGKSQDDGVPAPQTTGTLAHERRERNARTAHWCSILPFLCRSSNT